MKINKVLKKLSVTFLCFVSLILLKNSNSQAVLQSNGNTPVIYSLYSGMVNIRNMEAIGGAMGLSENINSDLTTNGDSNNIDVHMQKNTEYGALAILSASSYGNPNKINDGDTTTGNVTGVVMKINSEWVAVQGNETITYKERYKNIYGSNKLEIVGDAMQETDGWHSSKNSAWFANWSGGMLRAFSGGIFSHCTHGALGSNYDNNNHIRAVVVQGQGF